MTENVSEIETQLTQLQDKVDDLRWRMNAVCNFLTIHFADKIDDVTKLCMTEEVKRD